MKHAPSVAAIIISLVAIVVSVSSRQEIKSKASVERTDGLSQYISENQKLTQQQNELQQHRIEKLEQKLQSMSDDRTDAILQDAEEELQQAKDRIASEK